MTQSGEAGADPLRPNKAIEADYIDEEYGREFTEEELAELFEEANKEEDGPPPFVGSPRFRKIIAGVLALMLCSQLFVIFPQVFSLAAIQFLKVSTKLSQMDTIKEYKQSVVVVSTDDAKGTGFIISSDGLIVTNRHVVGDAKNPSVSLAGGGRHSAKVVAIDDKVDLALLDIDAEDLPALQLAETYNGAAGVPVYVIGNPLFFSRIANEGETWGLLSDRDTPMMMLQAPIYKGNSGSPVINREGEVIGVVYATSTVKRDGKKHKIGLAVPIDWVWKHLP